MLEQEHQKAEKKIDETTKKAAKLEQIKEINDQTYLQTIADMEKKRMGVRTGHNYQIERRNRQSLIDNAKIEMYQIKKREVQQMKEQVQELRKKKQIDAMIELQAKKYKKENVKNGVQESTRNY